MIISTSSYLNTLALAQHYPIRKGFQPFCANTLPRNIYHWPIPPVSSPPPATDSFTWIRRQEPRRILPNKIRSLRLLSTRRLQTSRTVPIPQDTTITLSLQSNDSNLEGHGGNQLISTQIRAIQPAKYRRTRQGGTAWY